jgi:hypothetical protein
MEVLAVHPLKLTAEGAACNSTVTAWKLTERFFTNHLPRSEVRVSVLDALHTAFHFRFPFRMKRKLGV